MRYFKLKNVTANSQPSKHASSALSTDIPAAADGSRGIHANEKTQFISNTTSEMKSIQWPSKLEFSDFYLNEQEIDDLPWKQLAKQCECVNFQNCSLPVFFSRIDVFEL